MFGISKAAQWRSLEHGAWLLFETAFLLLGIAQSRGHLWQLSAFQVALSEERDQLEVKVEERVKELKEQRSFLRSLVDHLPCAVFWKGRDLRYAGGNEAFAKLAGYESTVGIVDQSVESRWSSEQSAKLRQTQLEILDCGEDQINREHTIEFANGRQVDVLSSHVPLRDDEGEIAGLIGILQDVSELKLLQRQLADVQQFVSMRQVGGTIANEIYEPLLRASGNFDFFKNCNELLFEVVESYRELVFDEMKMSQEKRLRDLQLILSDRRYDELRERAPVAIGETAEVMHQVLELVSAMKGPTPIGL